MRLVTRLFHRVATRFLIDSCEDPTRPASVPVAARRRICTRLQPILDGPILNVAVREARNEPGEDTP